MTFRFSIRAALLILTLGAGLSLILAQAVQGQIWAVGIVIAVACLPAAFLPYVFWYWVIRATSLVLTPKQPPANTPRQPN